MNKQSSKNTPPIRNPLLEKMNTLTKTYFGNDAPAYFTRFIKTHLRITPELVTRDDLISLIDWIELLASFFESDEAIVKNYMAELRSLIDPDTQERLEEDT
jgi:hypothetical protein